MNSYYLYKVLSSKKIAYILRNIFKGNGIYFEMQNFVHNKQEKMWKSDERDSTPKQQVEMKNLITLQRHSD